MTVALVLVAALLVALWPAARFFPDAFGRQAGAGCCAIGLLLAIASLLGLDAGGLEIGGLRIRLDGLSGWMLMPVLIAGSAAVLAGGRPAPVGAMLLVLLAGNAAMLAIALVLLGLLLRGRSISLLIWALCSALGFGIAAVQEPAVALLLALAGLVALWRAILRGEVGGFAAGFAALGLYVAARITLDFSGPATPVWWGVVMAGFGLVGAVLGGWRAAVAETVAPLIAGAAVSSGGLACAGLGVALAARGADLPPAAALGLEAALLLSLGQAATLGLLGLCREAGWAAVGAASLAALPPTAGFAGFYLLLQALFAANRIGGVGLQFACACAVAASGLAASLGALAALRILGFRMLGTPVAAREVRFGTIALAGIGALLGLAPGEVLLLVRPAVQKLVPGGLVDVSLWAPLIVAALLVGCFLAITQATRSPVRRAPAWQGGGAAAPNLAPYAPSVLASWRIPVPRPRPPSLREWLAAAAAVLALVLLVLAAR